MKKPTIKLAGRRKAQDLEWLKWAMDRPAPEDALWLVDFKSLNSLRYCVYVIAPDGKWPVKVGISHSPRSRLATLQVGNWKRLEVAYCFWVESMADALLIEREVHKDYADQNKWLLGEWIDARPQEARERIEWAALSLSIEASRSVPPEAVDYVKAKIEALWPWDQQYQAVAARYQMAV